VTLTNKLERIKIQKLLFYLDKVKKNHEKYMSNGKVFIDTIELRKINEKILVLIKEINLQDNKELKSSSLDLIEHLVEWISIWDKEKNIRTPSNDDEFIFNGYKKYPINFENLLIQHSIKLDEVE
jgi:hypothetical protein